MVINYAAPTGIGLFPGYAYPYAQILDSESDWGIKPLIESGFLRDKIVLVGATYEGAHDTYLTPFFLGTKLLTSKRKRLMPGVEVHANIIRTILGRAFITRLRFSQRVGLILALSLLVGLVMIRFRPIIGILLVAGVLALYVIAAVYLFVHQRCWIDIAAPSGSILLTYVGAVMYRFFAERRQKERIRGAFAHYVPRSVVNELIRHPEMLQLGGEERELSVLFSDVEGFTTIAEELTPMELRALLDEYLTPMTDIILNYKGIIDKYEGDAIMAEFGAPLPFPDHARRACFAAIEMQQALAELRKKWIQEGKPPLRCRIGINSGLMVIGNMGSQDIFDYTVIGDSVNIASRLEKANKRYGTYLMISEHTYEQVKQEVIVRELDIIRIKGKKEPVLGYELLAKASDGLPKHQMHMIKRFLRGLEAYKARNWDEAIACFQAALELVPEDGPSRTYLKRCQVFKKIPPSPDWDGVHILPTI